MSTGRSIKRILPKILIVFFIIFFIIFFVAFFVIFFIIFFIIFLSFFSSFFPSIFSSFFPSIFSSFFPSFFSSFFCRFFHHFFRRFFHHFFRRFFHHFFHRFFHHFFFCFFRHFFRRRPGISSFCGISIRWERTSRVGSERIRKVHPITWCRSCRRLRSAGSRFSKFSARIMTHPTERVGPRNIQKLAIFDFVCRGIFLYSQSLDVFLVGVRDYCHVVDIAEGHVAALKIFDKHFGLKVLMLEHSRMSIFQSKFLVPG